MKPSCAQYWLVGILVLFNATALAQTPAYNTNRPDRVQTDITTQQERQRLEYIHELQGKNEQERIGILKGENKLTVYEKYLANEFRLTEKDFKKYQKIMLGKRGYWSPGLDPLSALGVSEKNPKERDRYARLWLEVEAEKVDLQFEFERSVARNRKVVFGNMTPFNSQPKIDAWLERKTRPNANIDVYINASCLSDCDNKIANLKASRGRGKLNFYFIDMPTDDKIVRWAQHHNIPKQLVSDSVITLNHGRDKYNKIMSVSDGKDMELPHVIVTKIQYQED